MLRDLVQTADWQTVPISSCDGEVGPDGVVIHEVIGADSPYLPAAMELLRIIFPDYERYAADLRLCALQRSPAHPATLDHLWVIEKAGVPIGVRLFHYIYPRNVGYGAFIGLLADYRCQGVSSWLVNRTLAQLCADAQSFGRPEPPGYVIEVEPIHAAKDNADRVDCERRLAFHLKNNAYLLDVDYIEPPTIEGLDVIAADDLADVETGPMHLAFYPVRPDTRLTPPELINVIEALYIDSYRLEPDSGYVRRAIDSVMAHARIGC